MSFFQEVFGVDVVSNKEWTQVNCPFHSDSVASAGINLEKGLFHCFTCDITYNEVEFLARTHGISETDALMLLEANTNNVNSKKQWEQNQRLLFSDNSFLENVRNYWKISNEFIEKMELGLTLWKGQPMLSFPIFYNNIKLGATHYNLTKAKDIPKVIIDKGTEAGLVIPYDIWRMDKRKTYIVEGEKDMLAARAFGLNAITFTGGAMANIHDLVLPSFKDREVVILYDNDNAGRKGAIKKYLELKDIAKSVKQIDISEVVEEEREDFFDAVHKYNLDELSFTLLGEYDFILSEEEEQEEFITLSEAISKNIIGEKLKTRITVPAEYADIYLSKTGVLFEKKDIDTSHPNYKESQNILMPPFKKIWRLSKYNLKELLDLIEVKATDEEIYKQLKAKVGIPINEQFMSAVDITTANIYKSRITDNTTDAMFDEDEMENYTVDAYSFSKLNVGEEYIIEYYLYPHSKRHQKLVAIVVDAKHTSSVANFEPNYDLLKEFQHEGTIDEHLDYLYESAKHYVAKHLNKDIWLMNELVFNSLYEIPYDDKIWHGTLDVAVIGDPRTGKSETSEKLTKLYNFGNFVNLKTSSVVGLTAGSNKVDGTWLNTIGVLPRNHKRLVVMEELSGAAPEFVKTMTDVRSSGRMRLARAAGQLDVPCRLRMITISNPISSTSGEARTLNTFPNGVQPISELIKASEDIARYDAFLLVVAPRYRVDPNTITLTGYKIPKEAYEHKADFTYTRTVENVIYGEGVESYIWNTAQELNDMFESSFSLFGTTTHLKLARFSAAMANLLMRTDGKGNIIIEKDVVDKVKQFLIKIYDNEIFKLADYKKEWQSYNVAYKRDIQTVEALYEGNSVMLEYLESVSEVSRKNLHLVSGLEGADFAAVFSRLVSGRFVRLQGETVIPTGKLRQSLRKINREFRADLSLVDSYDDAEVDF